MTDKHVLKIEFDNEEALQHFASWLCGAGEQDYWEWMRCREGEKNGPITATNFNYHDGPDLKFMADNTIETTCGRLTQQHDDDPSRL